MAFVAEQGLEAAPAARTSLRDLWQSSPPTKAAMTSLPAEDRPPMEAGAALGQSEPAARRPAPAVPEPYAEIRRLAVAVRAGDAAAREALLERLAPLARGTARRAAGYARRVGLAAILSREDLEQEARAMLLELMETCDPAVGAPLLYLTVRLRSQLKRYVQAQARRRPAGRRLDWGSQAAQDLLEALSARLFREAGATADSGAEAALHEALEALPLRQRRLLYWSFWRELTDAEIAAQQRLSVPAVRQIRYRALATLRRALGERMGGGPDAEA